MLPLTCQISLVFGRLLAASPFLIRGGMTKMARRAGWRLAGGSGTASEEDGDGDDGRSGDALARSFLATSG